MSFTIDHEQHNFSSFNKIFYYMFLNEYPWDTNYYLSLKYLSNILLIDNTIN